MLLLSCNIQKSKLNLREVFLLLNINSIMLCLKNCGVWYLGFTQYDIDGV